MIPARLQRDGHRARATVSTPAQHKGEATRPVSRRSEVTRGPEMPKQKPGRKPSGIAEVRVDLKFPASLKAACQEAALEDGVALNEWLREAARRRLTSPSPSPTPIPDLCYLA